MNSADRIKKKIFDKLENAIDKNNIEKASELVRLAALLLPKTLNDLIVNEKDHYDMKGFKFDESLDVRDLLKEKTFNVQDAIKFTVDYIESAKNNKIFSFFIVECSENTYKKIEKMKELLENNPDFILNEVNLIMKKDFEEYYPPLIDNIIESIDFFLKTS